MNHIPDSELALCAGGDLPLPEHLVECAECQSRLGDVQAAMEYLRSVAAEPDDEQVRALRREVLQHIGRSHRWRWFGAAAAFAALVIAAIGIGMRRRNDTELMEPVAAAQIALPQRQYVSLGRLPKNLQRRVRPKSPAMTLIANAGGDPVVRLRTSDPNVVVLWVLNTEKSEENSRE